MLVSGVVAGILVGLAVGRDWRRFERLDVGLFPLLAAGLAARAAAPFNSGFALALYLLSILIVALVGVWNWRLPGALFVAAGSGLNLLVVVANGGMPVDFTALSAVGGTLPRDGLHIGLNASTTFGALADTIAIGVFRAAYSVGDFLILIGGFLLPFITLARR